MTPEKRFDFLRAWFQQIALLQSASDTLEWDAHTGLAAQAGPYRADQISFLRGLIHQRRTDPRVGEHLQELQGSALAADVHSPEGATIAHLLKDYQRDCRLPQSLVEALSRGTTVGQQHWEAARRADSFSQFSPALQTIVKLKREAAAHLQQGRQTLYEALLEEYEPGCNCELLQNVFSQLQQQLVPLVQQIQSAPRQPDLGILRRRFPIDAQRRFSRWVAEAIGFDFQRGRLDETVHPFCTSLGPHDCRILSRYEQHWFPGGFFGTLHEAGHGMYDQGLPTQWYGLPPGSFASLGIHESQSRLWENLIGRSQAFWSWNFPHARAAFPDALTDVTVQQMHFAVNAVRPSLIRVEADEATYNLHIIIRFQLEQALVEGDLQVDDLPTAWDEKFRQYLGIAAPTVADGVLQDVHWSAGLIGYFPTYTLGNLYSAQLLETASAELPQWERSISAGQFQPLLHWLRENIHHHGRIWQPAELMLRVTGTPLGCDALIRSLCTRYQQLYGW